MVNHVIHVRLVHACIVHKNACIVHTNTATCRHDTCKHAKTHPLCLSCKRAHTKWMTGDLVYYMLDHPN